MIIYDCGKPIDENEKLRICAGSTPIAPGGRG